MEKPKQGRQNEARQRVLCYNPPGSWNWRRTSCSWRSAEKPWPKGSRPQTSERYALLAARARLLRAPAVIAMEACASAHYWGRRFLATGHRVLLINPRFVKPFVKGSKNDAADAEGIYEAALRPTMRFVPVKSIEQQDLQLLHRARERVVCARTALINHMRGLLAEYGVILPQGAWRFTTQVTTAIEEAELSELTREIFMDILDQFNDLNRQLDKFDAQL